MARSAEALHEETRRHGGATDEDLVTEMATGSTAALQELFRRVAPLVYALAVRIERNEADAEEVLVDSFYQAWRQAGDYDSGRGKAVGWLLSITRSRAIDRLRTRRRNGEKTERYAEETVTFPAPGPPSPEDQAIRSDRRTTVHRALAELPRDQRWAIELAYFLGFSQSQIAARLGLPLGTIKTRMRLGLEKLRNQLGGTT